jgi:phosphate transport system protein
VSAARALLEATVRPRNSCSAEQQINAWQTDIEAESFRLLARQAPVASDLRTVLAICRAVTDLERAGDEAKKIARFALAARPRAQRVRRGVMHRPAAAHGRARLGIDARRGGARPRRRRRPDVARLDHAIDHEFERGAPAAHDRRDGAHADARPVFDTRVRAEEPRADRRPRQNVASTW